MTDRSTLYHRCQLPTKPNPELIYAALMLSRVTGKIIFETWWSCKNEEINGNDSKESSGGGPLNTATSRGVIRFLQMENTAISYSA